MTAIRSFFTALALQLSDFLAGPIAILSQPSVRWKSPRNETRPTLMLDAVFVLVTIAFFAVSIGYVAGCDRLR